MLAHNDFNDITFVTYNQDIFTTFMFEDGAFVTHSFNLSKNGSNRHHSMLSFHKENTALQKNKGILPTFMLMHLEILYSFGASFIAGR